MNRKLYAIVTAAVLCGTGTTWAALVENFNSYTSQTAFQEVWRPYSANDSSMTLDTSGRNGSRGVRGVASANNQTRNIRNLDDFNMYKGTDASAVTFEFWLYDSNPVLPASPAGARNFNEIRAYAGAGYPSYSSSSTYLQGIVAMGLYNTPISDDNYHVRVYYGGVNAWYSLNTTRTPGWHKMTAQIGGTNVKFFVDGQLDTTVNFTNLDKVYAFDSVTLGSALTSGGYDVAFDDLSVTKAPDPATLVMLAVGGLVLRRRQGAA